MSDLQSLIARMSMNRNWHQEPFRIIAVHQRTERAHTWEYPANPREARRLLVWWRDELLKLGYTLCQQEDFWVLLHIPDTGDTPAHLLVTVLFVGAPALPELDTLTVFSSN